jgi:hypothetical protein
MSFDNSKTVYLFVHGRMDLMQKSVDALVAKGFSKDKITPAVPTKVGQVGEYMAMLWRPPTPDHIKLQKIAAVEPVEPQGMIGLWKGVKAEDITTIPL